MIVSAEPLDAWLVPRPWLALYGNWIKAGHSPLTEVRLLRCTMRVRAVRTPQAALCLAYATASSADMHIQDSAAPLRRHHAANFLQPICSRSCHGKYDLQAVVPDIEGAREGHHACLPLCRIWPSRLTDCFAFQAPQLWKRHCFSVFANTSREQALSLLRTAYG